jgi:hypothetical protein
MSFSQEEVPTHQALTSAPCVNSPPTMNRVEKEAMFGKGAVLGSERSSY